MSTETSPVTTPLAASRNNSSTGSHGGFLGKAVDLGVTVVVVQRDQDEEKGPDPTVTVATPIDQVIPDHNTLGWKRTTIVLIVEAIALGTLSIPKAFAAVGMFAGVFLTVSLGLIAIYTAHLVGEVKIKYPRVENYPDAVGLFGGRFGYEMTGFMFVLFLILIVGSHALTGTMALNRIIGKPEYCALYWSGISGLILLVLALPPTFKGFAKLGYIDTASILAAIVLVIISTGIDAHNAPGGLSSIEWSIWSPPDMDFYKIFLAVSNIIFAYSFTVCQYTVMAEMRAPKDYKKSIWSIGLIEIFIYTITGALIYRFVGKDVESPALLSANSKISRIAFGIALPVIYISGSINSTVMAKYIMNRTVKNSSIRMVKSRSGWVVWVSLIAAATAIAWVIAEAVPIFDALLGLTSSLLISGFSFYFPALFWFFLLMEGKWYQGWNLFLSIANAFIFLIGVTVFAAGTYASVKEIIAQYAAGTVRAPFTCSAEAYM